MSPNSKRSIWIGGGIAVAAVLAVAFFTIDYPPDGSKTAGTVAPAQRYRAEQPKAGDVKLGDQAVAQLMQTEAFDRFVKDPSTRALAADPNFQALARTHANGLVALAAHPDAAAVVAAVANAQLAKSQANAQVAATQTAAQINNAQVAATQTAAQVNSAQVAATQTAAQVAATQRVDAFAKFGAEANALQSLALAPQTAQMMAQHLDAIAVAARSQNFATLLANNAFANALAASTLTNAAANGTSTNAQQK